MIRRLYHNLILKQRQLLLGFVTLATVVGVALPADAALLDWLFPRRRAAQRQYYVLPAGTTAAAPYTASYAPYTANSAPYTTNYAPYTTNYAPHTTNYGSWRPSTTPYAWYAPQTQYRSLWAQVPVTTYRPVGTNSLQPCTSYAWQTQRVPVTSFQPALGAVTAPATNSCGCSGAATTAYYGSTPAYSQWQTVAPSTGNLYGYSSGGQFASAITPATTLPATTLPTTTGQAVTAGYAPDNPSGTTTLDYANATPWTPVDNTYAQTDSDSQWQPYAGTTGSAPASESSGDAAGATPWQPVDGSAETTPADQSPTLYDSDRDRDSDRTRTESQRPEVDDRLRQYDDGRDLDSGGSTTRTGHFRPNSPQTNERFVPFQRPIPDPDRDYNWDFDDKFQRRDRPQRSARRSDSRWEAIPTYSPQPGDVRSTSDSYQAPDDSRLPVARPRRPANEGGWRSLAQ